MTVYRADCQDCAWDVADEDRRIVSEAMERHERKERHDIRFERVPMTDGGRDDDDPDAGSGGSRKIGDLEGAEVLDVEGQAILGLQCSEGTVGVRVSEEWVGPLKRTVAELDELVGDDAVDEPEVATDGGQSVDGTDRIEEFEEKLDELNEGLLEAYAAGFAKGAETFGSESACTDHRELMQDRMVSESHYYFWDGRTKPLEFWLREQFEIDDKPVQNDDLEDDDDAKRDWKCKNCGYRPRLIYVDEPVDSCSICGSDEWSVRTDADQEVRTDGGQCVDGTDHDPQAQDPRGSRQDAGQGRDDLGGAVTCPFCDDEMSGRKIPDHIQSDHSVDADADQKVRTDGGDAPHCDRTHRCEICGTDFETERELVQHNCDDQDESDLLATDGSGEPAREDVDHQPIHVGDHVTDLEADDGATIVVVGTPSEPASEFEIPGGMEPAETVADYNPGYPSDDNVVEAVYPQRTDKTLGVDAPYSFPRSRVEIVASVHDVDDDDGSEGWEVTDDD